MPADPAFPINRNVERARNTAHLWLGVAVIFAVLAALQWLSSDDLWSRLLSTSGALAYAGVAWQARRKAGAALSRGEAADAGTGR